MTPAARTAGILAYPPEMQKDIFAWVKSLYATWTATRCREEIRKLKQAAKEARAELEEVTEQREVKRLNDRLELWDDDIKGLTLILNIAVKDGAKGRGRKTSKKVFETNLSGMPANYPVEALSKKISKITVEVTFTGKRPPGRATYGTWNSDRKKLTVLLHGSPPNQVFKYYESLKLLDTIIQHELRHMVQRMFFEFEVDLIEAKALERGKTWDDLTPKEQERIRKSISRGSPREYEVGSLGLYKDLPKSEKYYLLPQEFFTLLGTSEDDFYKEVHVLRVAQGARAKELKDLRPTKEEFNQFVGNPKPITGSRIYRKGDPITTYPFFAALWKYDRKRWQRAVRELWKRVQPKLAKTSAARVAARYLSGRTLSEGPSLFREFKKTWENLDRRIGEDLARAGITREDYLFGAKSKTLGLQVDPSKGRVLARDLQRTGKISWVWMIEAARHWVDYLLQLKSVPRGKAKMFELAARPFSSARRPPRDIVAWVEKNRDKHRFLVEAERWPDKTSDGDSEEIFKVGPFTVHNTVQETGKKLDETKKVVEKGAVHLQRARVPGLQRVLYGDILIVGRLSQPRTLAWYNPSDDKVYVRPHLKVGKTELHNFLHEMGHRYWAKFMARGPKGKWMGWHRVMKIRMPDVELPEVGKPLPVPVSGMKRGGPPIVTDANRRFISVRHEATGREAQIPWRTYENIQGRKMQFPTLYSASNEEEHFCEALALYLTGGLVDPHRSAFEAIVLRDENPSEGAVRVAQKHLVKRLTPEALKEARD